MLPCWRMACTVMNKSPSYSNVSFSSDEISISLLHKSTCHCCWMAVIVNRQIRSFLHCARTGKCRNVNSLIESSRAHVRRVRIGNELGWTSKFNRIHWQNRFNGPKFHDQSFITTFQEEGVASNSIPFVNWRLFVASRWSQISWESCSAFVTF